MFKLFERQPNWTLKQLIQTTDQPEVCKPFFRNRHKKCGNRDFIDESNTNLEFDPLKYDTTIYYYYTTMQTNVSLVIFIAAISQRYA